MEDLYLTKRRCPVCNKKIAPMMLLNLKKIPTKHILCYNYFSKRHAQYIIDNNLTKEYLKYLEPTITRTIKHLIALSIMVVSILFILPTYGYSTSRISSYLGLHYILALLVIFVFIFLEVLYRTNYKLFKQNVSKVK